MVPDHPHDDLTRSDAAALRHEVGNRLTVILGRAYHLKRLMHQSVHLSEADRAAMQRSLLILCAEAALLTARLEPQGQSASVLETDQAPRP